MTSGLHSLGRPVNFPRLRITRNLSVVYTFDSGGTQSSFLPDLFAFTLPSTAKCIADRLRGCSVVITNRIYKEFIARME